MTRQSRIYEFRRLVLVACLVAAGFAAGFLWGEGYGYKKGRVDTVDYILNGIKKIRPLANK